METAELQCHLDQSSQDLQYAVYKTSFCCAAEQCCVIHKFMNASEARRERKKNTCLCSLSAVSLTVNHRSSFRRGLQERNTSFRFQQAAVGVTYFLLRSQVSWPEGPFTEQRDKRYSSWTAREAELHWGLATVKQVPEATASIRGGKECVSCCGRVARRGLPQSSFPSSFSTVKIERDRARKRKHTRYSEQRCVQSVSGEAGERCEWISRKTWEGCHVSAASDHRDEWRGGWDLHVITAGESDPQTRLNHLHEREKQLWLEGNVMVCGDADRSNRQGQAFRNVKNAPLTSR